MSGKKKAPAQPNMDGLTEDWNRVTALRAQEHAAAQTPAAAPAPSAPSAPQKEEPEKTRRSWYVERDAAEAFQAAVDDVHHATRRPKHEVASLLLRAAAERADEVADKISHTYHA
ncbi:hypothetical protein [Nocardiopsis halophila]|uniref:hypothetical protein n=1 Tax=Nocardiopsis halophila TaxID=141692 RepID=UPI0003486B53|nr:hypothetical protein [Nocardiopsis halophila]